jgi:hypothetical protein
MENGLTLESFLSSVTGLFVLYILRDTNLPIVIKYFVLPLMVMNIAHMILVKLLPFIGLNTQKINLYFQNNVLGTINGINYMEIFPPLLLVMVIFFVMLYNKKLSSN